MFKVDRKNLDVNDECVNKKYTKTTTVVEVVLVGVFVVNFEHVCSNSPEAYLGYCQTLTSIYFFKVDGGNTRTVREICFGQISHIVLVCSFLTWSR